MPLEGQHIDRYHVLRLLGGGGMGDVYLAEDPHIGQQVAIKVIRTEPGAYPHTSSTVEAAHLFYREAKAIVKLDHPHILSLFNYGEERIGDLPVIYLVMGYAPDHSNAGGEDSPNPRKELALCLMRERPELKGKLLTWGSWDFQIVPELAPQPGELVITKARYSGFAGTNLDSVLRGRGIRNLLMMGIASNVCVESTLRDAYFHEYWPVLIEDGSMPAGSPEIHAATVYNVKTFFGWVTTAQDVATALREAAVLQA